MDKNVELKNFSLVSKYWRNKTSNRDKVLALQCQKIKLSVVTIDVKDLNYFSRITNKNSVAQNTVINAVFSFLLKKLIWEFDGYIAAAFENEKNPLLFSFSTELQISFKEFLQKVKLEIVETLNYSEYYSDKITERKEVNDLSELSNYCISINSDLNLECNGILFNVEIEETGTINIQTTYLEGFVKETIVKRLVQYFVKFIMNLEDNLNNDLLEYSLLSENEKHEVLVNFNSTIKLYSDEKTIIDLFEEQVEKSTNNTAVIFNRQKKTYGQLNQEANQLARYISSNHTVSKGDIIGVFLPKSDTGIVSLLAILKLGAVYLPIDTSYPQERIDFMIKDSGLKLLIVDDILQKLFGCDTIAVNSINLKSFDSSNIRRTISAKDLAYIIYTSGSTGQPKGVMIEHTSNVNMSLDQIDSFNIHEEDRIVLFASVAFDASISEIMMSFYSGATLCIPTEETIKNKEEFVDFLYETKATVVTFPPSYLGLLSEKDISGLRCIITAGEPANQAKALGVIESGIDYYNAYGPTECAVCVSIYKVNKNDVDKSIVSIGKPISNTQIFILDDALQPVAIGVTGKLYVAGKGVARGYLNKPVLTAEKFVVNPFENGTLMYDTGDLACWLPDGNIDFLGREDQQVKLRGYRIELGEIENAILQFSDDFNQAVVEVKENKKEKVLVAYLVIAGTVDKSQLRYFLENRLPDYMVPNFYVLLKELPLTPNGKIDRKKLPEISDEDITRKEYVAPRNEIEEKLVKIWEEVLGIEKIGITDNFFELGGHSLVVAQVINRSYKELDKSVSFKTFFENATIANLSSELKEDKYFNIDLAPHSLSYPLTASQNRIWLMSQMDGGALAYHMPAVVKLTGIIEVNKFQESFRRLIRRHEILRTCFRLNQEGKVRQYIEPFEKIDFKIEEKDYSARENQEENIADYLQRINLVPFDLENGPLMKVSVLKLREEEHVLFLSLHHIIGDGWSIEILMSEFFETYNSLTKGKEPVLPKLNFQYKDYAVWLNNGIVQEKYKLSEQYWLKQFAGELPVLNIPSFRTRPLIKTFKGDRYAHQFSSVFLEKIKVFSKAHDVTFFMTLMAAINALLFKYTRQNDIVIGTPIAGRQHCDLENQMGLYLNTLAIRTQVKEFTTFLDLLKLQKENLSDAYDHQEYPFDALVTNLNLKRDTSRSALFDVLVVLQNQTQLNNFRNEQLTGLTVDNYDFSKKTSQFDISFIFVESEGLNLTIEYNTDIYDKYLIERMFFHLENLLLSSLENPLEFIQKMDFLGTFEKRELLIGFNNTAADYPNDTTLIALFEEQVEKTPDVPAVIFENTKLTYRELNEKSNQLAHCLKYNYSVVKGDVVGLQLNRSEWSIISILAILKAGAVYVPLDAELPDERKEFIATDAQFKLLVTESVYVLDLDFYEGNIFKIDVEFTASDFSKESLELSTDASDLAYIIYTSGSTGKPKGVLIENEGVVNTILSQIEIFDLAHCQNSLQFASFSFDASISEIFITLLSGASLFVLSETRRKDIKLLETYILENNIEIATLPPAYLKLIDVKSLKGLKALITAGEAPIYDKVVEYLQYGTFYNAYGPTETSICGSVYKIEKESKLNSLTIPIGSPISNVEILILDEFNNLQPVGVVGKIFISGKGLARGYLNKPDLTQEKFVPNPFKDKARMYDTGDLGKWLPDGNIEYIGRDDHQVKIRGNRIELGEIENAILQYSKNLKQAVVELKENIQDKVLVAYLVVDSNIDKLELRSFLQEKLPDYMIPNFYVTLDNLPLTINGKIDRKALPDISEEDIVKREYLAPRDITEKILVEIWQEVLALQEIGITHNFFELGGNSLTIVQIINKVHKKLDKTLSFNTIFENPTVEGLAKQLQKKQYIGIPKAEKAELYPLSSSQFRIWVLSQMESASIAYNMPGVIRLVGEIDANKFEESFRLLIQRHEILRTYFKTNDLGNVSQHIKQIEKTDFTISKIDFSKIADQEEIVEEYLQEKNKEPFDLEQAPLLRANLIKLGENNHLFFLSMHHIIGDGWSIELLIAEIIEVYNSLTLRKEINLPALVIQYKDYAVWSKNELQQENLKLSENYWLQQFEGELPILDLPSFKTRPLIQTYNGKSLIGHFSKEFLDKLKNFSKENDLTLFMTLTAGINALLYRYTGQNDIILGTPVAGRKHPDLENQLGLYLNTLAIRTIIDEESCFLDLVINQKEVLLSAYEHQDYPFDELIDKLNIKKDTSRSTLYDVMIVLQNQEQLKNINKEEISGLEIHQYAFSRKTAQSDIRFAFTEKEGLELMIDFNTDIYDDYLIQRIFLHFENLMNSVLEETNKNIQEIEFLTEIERKQLIFEFNNTDVNYPKDKTIVSLFEEQVVNTINQTALVFGNTSLSYNELNQKANQLAHYLRDEYCIEPNDLIGVKLDRSEQMIIAILGVLKSGGAYVPIDTNYPKERIAFIEKDINCKVIIDEDELSMFNLQRFRFSDENPDHISITSDLAYVIYTSGSTGNPKGVMVEHGNVIRLIKPGSYFPLDETNILLSTGSVSFDATIIEYFGTLLNGSRLILTSQNNLLDLDNLEDVIKINKVNSMWMTASWFNQVVENNINVFKNINQLIVGGDVVSPKHTKKVFESNPAIKIVNGYGPTENTTFSLTFEIQNENYSTIPIGKPIENSYAYILSNKLQPVATGVIGQLYVSGAGVARGYLNQKELSDERFLSNPFLNGGRLYNTGDLCKWLPDGNIEFLGRKDHQVKIRGFRIELGEIENTLLQYSESLNNVVVEVKEVHQEKVLVVYIVSTNNLDKNDIKIYLQGKLPEYMIPSFYIMLEELPLTSNGKIDRKALPDVLGEDIVRKEYVAPGNSAEEQLVVIWQEVLGIEKIGVTDNFFELGGDSIRSIRLLSRINNALSLNYKLSDIYELSSIKELLSIQSSRLKSGVSSVIKDKVREEFVSLSKEINSEDIESIFPISDIEGGMLYASFLNINEGVYHDQFLFHIPVVIFDRSTFVQCLQLLVEKHEILRTAFNLNDYSVPVHLVYKSIEVQLEEEDISEKDSDAQHDHLKKFMIKERTENPFEIGKPGLWRMKVYKTATEQWHLLFQFHHAILDGWSLASFITELNNIYIGIQNKEVRELEKLSLSYKDYVFTQNCDKEDENKFAYWENKLEDHKRLDIFTDEIVSERYDFVIEEEFYDLLKTYCASHAISVKVICFAAYLYTLQMLSYDNDLTTGIVSNGRPLSDDGDKLLGCFLNTIPFRLTEFNGSVSEFVKYIDNTLKNQKKFEGISLFELHKRFPLSPKGENPFFDTMFNYIDFHIFNELDLQGAKSVKESEFTDINFATNNTFLSLTICPIHEGVRVSWHQQRLLKNGVTIEKLQTYYANFLELLLVRKSDTALSKDLLISHKEKEKLLITFNKKEVFYPKNKTIIDLFEEQVSRNPDKIAVISDGVHLTYKELNEKANLLANYLKKQGIKKGSNVILCFDSCLHTAMEGMIGILKSGALYVPIDPDFPQDRIRYIVENTETQFIITNNIDNPLFSNEAIETIVLNEKTFDYNFESVKNLEEDITGNEGAYIIYTSGSTGTPKGVLVNHQNIMDYVFGLSAEIEIEKNHSFALMSTISTDLGNTVLFSSLIFGGTIHLFSKNKLRDMYFMQQYFIDNNIDCIKIVPSYWKFLEIEGKLLSPRKMIIFGGEELSTETVKRIYLEYPNLKIVNHYGPTETTIGKLLHLIDPNFEYSKIPIGKPFSNTQLYVVDRKLSLSPIGVPGELLIGGDGVSDGYYNNTELTDEKFIGNLFKDKASKLYKTGDLVVMHSDGNIEFKGRIDNQIKILGHRIELSEIEAVLNNFPLIKSSIVQVNGSVEDNKGLVAYIVPSGEFSNLDLRKYLELHLPNVMIPVTIMEIDVIPLTSNGKLDRKALPLIKENKLFQKEYVKPRNATEEKLAEIWKEVLGVDQIGISDNFFELGGHSLLLGQVINRTQKQLGKTISFKMFFANPTIEGLSRDLQQNKYLPIIRTSEAVSYPLTASQMRLWILSQLEGGSLAYNMPAAIKLKGAVDINKFEESFKGLIYRHEILRTYFDTSTQGDVHQFIIPAEEIEFKIAQVDYSLEENKETAIKAYVQERSSEVFNLQHAPLIKAALIKLDEEEFVFFFLLHHIISDGWSMELLISEITKTYNALNQGKKIDLPMLNIQYKDYSAWLNTELQQEKQKAAELYWMKQFVGELPVLNLPSFKTRPLIQTYNGERSSYEFSGAFLKKLKAFSKDRDVTLFMTLMAGINTLLYKYTGQNDIIVGTPIAGREHPDLENQLGLYLNTLAIRTQFDQTCSFSDLIDIQKEVLLGAYEHQNYPFDSLIGKLNLRRDTSRSALFDVAVVLQSQKQLNNVEKEELNGLEVCAYEILNQTSKFDLNFTFIENEGLSLLIDFNSDIYDFYLIERMFAHFENIINASLAEPELELHAIEHFTPSEEYQLLKTFNDTAAGYPKDKTIVDLFEEQVAATPDNIAVSFQDKALTYKELNEKANQLGHYIRQKYHIEPDDLIGIKLERSEQMIISILAILKSGAAYVPIDPDYPQDRIEYIENDSKSKFIIDKYQLKLFYKEQDMYSKLNLEKINLPENLAYVIYTSGTTGNPKGTLLEHKNVVRLFFTDRPLFDFGEKDVWTMFHSYSFDFSVWEINGALLFGGKLVVVPKIIAQDAPAFLQLVHDHSVTILNQTPSSFYNLINCEKTEKRKDYKLRYVIFGGEALTPALLSDWSNKYPETKLINMYGITETTVHVTYKEIGANEMVSEQSNIGKPIPTLGCYILDPNKKNVSIGVFGELYITGSGLARGYLNRPDLTAEKFIPNPFIKGELMYKTGDLGRWLPNGDIEYVGRIDHQVKIRGFRIELVEIEIAILQYSDKINMAVVEVKEINKEKVLIAYLVSDSSVSKLELRSYLQGKLPDYMVPAFYIELDEIPLTLNGKVDRKALPLIKGEDIIRNDYMAPENETEEKLVKIWQEVLGIEEIGVKDNFFELGGNSLTVMKLIGIINLAFGVKITISDIFYNSNIRSISFIINELKTISVSQNRKSKKII